MVFAEGYMYIDNVLHCGRVSAEDVVAGCGSPSYLYNLDAVAEQYRAYETAFEGIGHSTNYAVKANSSLVLLDTLVKAGCGFDVNSRGELFRVLKVGADPQKITMTGVGKSAADINDGLEAGILLFNAESFEECVLINRLAGARDIIARVVLRINPNVDVHTHPYIATGLSEHKFGLSEEDAYDVLPDIAALPHIEIAGFGMHLGSQLFEAAPFIEGLTKLLYFSGAVSPLLRKPVSVINMGGGLGVRYCEADPVFAVEELADAVKAVLAPYVEAFPALSLLSEPGRYMVANAGVLLAKVEYVKRTNNRTFVILDAGMNDLIRPALYEAYHEILPVRLLPERGNETVEIAGPVCESGDMFATQRVMQRVEEGEYVAIFSAGAYGAVMSSRYNSRPFAAEAVVRDGAWFIARERETLEQMMGNEKFIKR